jgi:hypothetical protein
MWLKLTDSELMPAVDIATRGMPRWSASWRRVIDVSLGLGAP